MKKNLIIICYINDHGIHALTKEIVDDIIKSLESKGFELTLEGSFTKYLGINYHQNTDNSITMTQEGLI